MDPYERIELLVSLRGLLTPLQYRIVVCRFFRDLTREETCLKTGIGKQRYYSELAAMRTKVLRSALLTGITYGRGLVNA